MLKYLFPAALAVTLLPTVATAQAIPAAVHVAYRDLDLRTADGVRTFDRRIADAIATVCPDSFAIDAATKRLLAHCQASARAGVAAQREVVLARAGRGNVEVADRTVR